MQQTVQNLLKVKSVITLMLSSVFCYLAVTQRISAGQFLSIFPTVIAFYFGTQAQRKIGNGG